MKTGKGMRIDAIPSLFKPKRLLTKKREKGGAADENLERMLFVYYPKGREYICGWTHSSKKLIEKQCF